MTAVLALLALFDVGAMLFLGAIGLGLLVCFVYARGLK